MPDLDPGEPFPDISLPDHRGTELSLSDIASEQPLVLCFVRGWWCPKEQVRLRGLVEMQDEIQREYGRLAVVTVDEPYVNGALRAGIGASFTFLSDEDRAVAERLGLIELTDEWHRPYLPMTYVLDSLLRIHAVWCGFWYWGNPTPDELRLALREITRREQPSFEPQRTRALMATRSGSRSRAAATSSGAECGGVSRPRKATTSSCRASTTGRGASTRSRARTAGSSSMCASRARPDRRGSWGTTSPCRSGFASRRRVAET